MCATALVAGAAAAASPAAFAESTSATTKSKGISSSSPDANLQNFAAHQTVEDATAAGKEGIDLKHDADDGSYWQDKWTQTEAGYASPDDNLEPGTEASKEWVKDTFIPWLKADGRSPAQIALATNKVVNSDYDAAVLRMIQIGLAYEAAGTPYAWGGGTINGPGVGSYDLASLDDDALKNEDWTHVGFDCARFMNHLLYIGFGIETSPGTENLLSELTAGGVGEDLGTDLAEAKPGDIIFYGTPTKHVGMVAEYSPGDVDSLRIVEAAPTDRGNQVKVNKVPTDEVTHIVRVTAAGETQIKS